MKSGWVTRTIHALLHHFTSFHCLLFLAAGVFYSCWHTWVLIGIASRGAHSHRHLIPFLIVNCLSSACLTAKASIGSFPPTRAITVRISRPCPIYSSLPNLPMNFISEARKITIWHSIRPPPKMQDAYRRKKGTTGQGETEVPAAEPSPFQYSLRIKCQAIPRRFPLE